jgi:hypothetical protein
MIIASFFFFECKMLLFIFFYSLNLYYTSIHCSPILYYASIQFNRANNIRINWNISFLLLHLFFFISSSSFLLLVVNKRIKEKFSKYEKLWRKRLITYYLLLTCWYMVFNVSGGSVLIFDMKMDDDLSGKSRMYQWILNIASK